MFPKKVPVGARLAASAVAVPTRSIGGDFFDYLELPCGQLGFLLGDVAEKGPRAALLRALMQGGLAFAAEGNRARPTQSLDCIERCSVARAYVRECEPILRYTAPARRYDRRNPQSIKDDAAGTTTRGGTVWDRRDGSGELTVEIIERTSRGVTVLELRGKLMLGEGVEQMREHVNQITGRGRSRIVLHLEHVPFADSAGLGEIVRTHITMQRLNGGLKLVRPSQRILALLQIAKVRGILDVCDSEDDAIAKFV